MITIATVGVLGSTLLVSPKQADAFWPFDGGEKTEQTDESGLPPFIQRLIARFGLNKDDVVNEMETYQAEKQEERKQDQQAKISQAVSDGLITQEQADAILAKLAEDQTWGQSLKDMTQEDRRSAMETHRDEMTSWLEGMGLEEGTLRDLGIGQFMGGDRGMGMEGPRGGQGNGQMNNRSAE